MKKLVYISGPIACGLIPIAYLFKKMHWPGASIILVVGVAIFSFVFVPTLAKYLYNKDK
jgi:hypothetical protein